MEEWKEYKLGDIASVQTGPFGSQLHNKDYVKIGTPIVTVEHLGSRMFTTQNLPRVSDADKARLEKYTLEEGDIVFSRVGSVDRCSFVSAKEAGWLFSGRCLRVRCNERIHPLFLYYYLQQEEVKQSIINIAVGATMPSINTKLLSEIQIVAPSKTNQKLIASTLSTLDDKIECNRRINDNFAISFLLLICFVLWLLRRINDNLQHQANALFKSWFVDFEPFRNGEFAEAEMGMIPKGWQVVSLISIAKYLNGLAMQNFRPEENDKGLPVLKIKELGQGMSDSSSDRCSSDIAKQYIVNDGDVIFSWSGTLLVDLWCGGQCGLNQHLFKVTSSYYPKWFYYMWTKQHLNNFIQIAKDKAVTMGHIKRGHLEEAKVLVPTETAMNAMTAIMQPIIDEIIDSRIESRRLSQLRDALLPRLMSGDLKVNEVDCLS